MTTILIIEDEVNLNKILADYLRHNGFQPVYAHTGKEGLQRWQESRPALVLLDLNLPDMDGLDVARTIRKSGQTPIIMVTARQEELDRLIGLELGEDDYITKPFDVQELRLRVRNALRRSTQGTLTNPVTNLPEGVLVEERLQDCLKNNEWAIILVSLRNLEKFRETYGFVAADDVLRAVNLMVHNAVREVGGTSDFIGHLTPDDFVLVTSLQNLAALHERIQTRLEQSLDYFYPLKDRERRHLKEGRLKLDVRQVTASDGPFKSLAGLKAKLLQ